MLSGFKKKLMNTKAGDGKDRIPKDRRAFKVYLKLWVHHTPLSFSFR